MSVYTVVEPPALEQFLQAYRIGKLLELEGIEAGVVNSNYFVTTTEGAYVLTLFEVLEVGELPYYLSLMAFLSGQGILSPAPVANVRGQHLAFLAGKPAALVEKRPGRSVLAPDELHCRELGSHIARLHRATKHFPARHPNDYALGWCKRTAEALYPALEEDDAQLLHAELKAQTGLNAALPRSTIHADLFRDNVLFDGDELSGIIDFYYACDEILLYDLAIALSDWCVGEDQKINLAKARALLSAYQDTRPVSEVEISNWPLVVRLTCLRWWLFRLERKHGIHNSDLSLKAPDKFRDLLRRFSDATAELIELWN